MKNKKELNLKDFMTNSWIRVKLLILTKLLDVKYPAKINIEEGLNQDNYNFNNKTGKYKLLKDIEIAKINDLLYTEKTKIIINGNLFYHFNHQMDFITVSTKVYCLSGHIIYELSCYLST